MTPRQFEKKQFLKAKAQGLKPYQKISNTFIDNVIINSNASALKTMYYLSTVLEPLLLGDKYSKKPNRIISVDINLKDALEYTELSLVEVKRNIKAMQETSITFIDMNEDTIEGMSLLPRYKLIPGKNIIEIDIYTQIAILIVDVKNNYTFINTKTLMNLKSKHSLRLLPILNRINQYSKDVGKRKKFDLDELNDLFGTKYKRLQDIERFILAPSKQELDLNSKLSFIYEINFEAVALGRPKASNIVIDIKDNSGSLFAL